MILIALRKPKETVVPADLYGFISLFKTVRLFNVGELATIALPNLVRSTSKARSSIVTLGTVISNNVNLPLASPGVPVKLIIGFSGSAFLIVSSLLTNTCSS